MASIGELKELLMYYTEEIEQQMSTLRECYASVDAYRQEIPKVLSKASQEDPIDEDLMAAIEEANNVVDDIVASMENAIYTLDCTTSNTTEYVYSL